MVNCLCVSSQIYDKRDDFNFDIVNVPFLDGDVFGACISQLVRFDSVGSHVTCLNAQNKCLIAKFLQQGYRYYKRPT